MATGLLNNGDYTIEDDSNGNLIVTDANDNTVLTYDDSAGSWVMESLSTEDGTIGGVPILGGPAASSSVTISFDTWTTIDANQPALFQFTISAKTDGTTEARVYFGVDVSGGTTVDFESVIAWADPGLGSGGETATPLTVYLPAGAQVKIRNDKDPDGTNGIQNPRKWVMSS